MAKFLRKLEWTVTKDYSGTDTRQIPMAATIDVYRQGATCVNATNSPVTTGETAQAITVLDVGDIKAGDTLKVWSGSALSADTVTVDSVTKTLDGQANQTVTVSHASGSFAFAANYRLVPTNNQPTLYTERSGTTTQTNPVTTGSTTGYGRAFVARRFVDCIISGSGYTTALREDEATGDDGGVLNVMDYGGNSNAAIQAAVDAAIAGQTVYLPSGQYSIGTTININKMLRFVGDGPQATILVGTDSAVDIIKLASGSERVYVADMTIQNNDYVADVGRAIYADASHYAHIHNVFVQNIPGSGIHMDGSNYPLITHCRVTACLGAGIFLDGIAGVGAQARIFHTECTANDWWGIYIDEHAGVQIDGIACENNCQDMSNAPDVGGADSNNAINAPQLYVYGADTVFIGRIDIEDFQNSPANTGIFLRDVNGAFIGGVTFVENNATAAGVGLRLDNCEGVTIVGNKFHSMDKGIFVQGGNTTMPTSSPSAVGLMSKNVFIAGNWYGKAPGPGGAAVSSYDTTTPVTLDYAAETELDGMNITGEWECGWMVPRFDADALPTPTHDGMVVYTTDTDKLKVRAAGAWADCN